MEIKLNTNLDMGLKILSDCLNLTVLTDLIKNCLYSFEEGLVVVGGLGVEGMMHTKIYETDFMNLGLNISMIACCCSLLLSSNKFVIISSIVFLSSTEISDIRAGFGFIDMIVLLCNMCKED